jgi:preprotein translocase subunit SecG
MREEKKIVTWSLVILFLSLAIVYSLAYMRKTDVFTNDPEIQKQEIQKSDEEPQINTGNEIRNQNSDIPVIDVSKSS